MNIELQGFHGTNKHHVGSILINGFKLSVGDEEWLGDGAYFFVRGVGKDPFEQAKQWAILESWDKNRMLHKYSYYSVLSADIHVPETNFLDLTCSDGVEVLEYVQKKCIQKLLAKRDMKRLRFVDGFLINFARGEKIFDVQAAKANCFIQLTKDERIFRIARRVPNCTICAVYNTEKNIRSIKQVTYGRITL